MMYFWESFRVYKHLPEVEGTGCLPLIVFLLLSGCMCSVSLPRGAIGWSVIRSYDISWAYSYCFCMLFCHWFLT